MASGATKVRLVTCPKCRRVLPELEDHPVYKCGGCGATLKAKNRKENKESGSLKALENNPAQKNESDHDSQGKGLTCSSQKAILCSTEECEPVESGNFDEKQSGNRSISNEFSSSELNHHEKEESSSEAEGNRKSNENSTGSNSTLTSQRPSGDNSSLNEQLEIAHQEIVCCESDHLRSRDNMETTEPTGNGIISEEDMVETRQSGIRSISNEFSSSELNRHEKEESSSEAEGNRKSDENSTGSNSTLTSQRPSGDNSSLNEQLEIAHQEIVCCESDHLRSRDNMETTEPTDNGIISEEDMVETRLYEGPRDFSKSSTNRSSHAYYDGSVSSYDGWDDHVSDLHLLLSKRTSFESKRVAEFASIKGRRPTREEVQHQAKKLSSMSLNEKPTAVFMGNVANWNQDELPQRLNSHGSDSFHSAQNWIGLETDEFRSKDPLYRRGYENGSPSNYKKEKFRWSSNLYASEKLDYVERNQMELLKKVDELRDQLINGSYVHKGKVNGGFPIQQDKQCPSYYRKDVNYPQNPGPRRKSMSHQRGFPQLYFSGQAATNCRHHHRYTDYSCFHGYHDEDSQNYYSEGLCSRAAPLGHHMCYNPCSSSGPSSPQRHLHSNFSHDLRCIDRRELNMYHKERRQPMKRHCRPIAGGAPFVNCYWCHKLLQIPVDFFLSSRRCHRLQCGSCGEVLVFSLNKRSNIVPYSSNLTVPPPSEVDNISAAATSMRRNIASTSQANDSAAQGDPVSYSEEYKSGSTDPAFLMSAFPVLQTSDVYKKQPSSNYAELIKERKEKSIVKMSRNKHRLSIETSDSASVISNDVNFEKLSSGVEIVPRTTGSPLHRLMGYSSPSEIIYGSDAETNF